MSPADEPLHGRAADLDIQESCPTNPINPGDVQDADSQGGSGISGTRIAVRERLAGDVRVWRIAAQDIYTKYATADIHDHETMIQAYAALRATLRPLLAALDAEEAGR